MLRIAVIGGGISGVSCAYFLKEQLGKQSLPCEIKIYEKSTRIGGAVYTESVDNSLYEGGVDSFLSEEFEILKLCRELSLQGEILNSDESRRETWVYWEGKLRKMPKGLMMSIPTSFWPFITDSLVSWPGKIRMGMDLFIPKKKDDEDESFGDFIRRRLGQEAFDKIAEPLISGITGADVETMSIKNTFPLYPDLEKEYGSLIKGLYQKRKKFLKASHKPEFKSGSKSGPKSTRTKYSFFLSFKKGMNQLVERMANILGQETFVHGGIKTISRKADTAGATSFQILSDDGEKKEADLVILATPSYVSSQIVKDLDPTLADSLTTIPHNSAVIVNYTFKTSDIVRPLKGFGFVVPWRENRSIKAGSWTSLKFPGRCPEGTTVVRASISGSKVEACIHAEDAQIDEWVRQDLQAIAGIEAHPLMYRVYRWPRSRPQYTLGHSERVATIFQHLSKHENLYLTGCAYSGAGVAKCIRQSRALAKKIAKQIIPHTHAA